MGMNSDKNTCNIEEFLTPLMIPSIFPANTIGTKNSVIQCSVENSPIVLTSYKIPKPSNRRIFYLAPDYTAIF